MWAELRRAGGLEWIWGESLRRDYWGLVDGWRWRAMGCLCVIHDAVGIRRGALSEGGGLGGGAGWVVGGSHGGFRAGRALPGAWC